MWQELSSVRPSPEALRLAQETHKHSRFVELVLSESPGGSVGGCPLDQPLPYFDSSPEVIRLVVMSAP